VVLNTIAEHNSNELPWRFAEGVTLVRTAVDDEGFPDLREMERLLREYNLDEAHGRKRIRVVAVSGASNVLGACPDLAEISRMAHRYGALVFVDAAQLAAHRAIRMAADGIDVLAFSGHKMYAPFGTGGLILRRGLWRAGDEAFQAARESGDENVTGVAALGKAIDLLERIGMDVVHEEELKLTRMALRELASVPGVRIYGIVEPDSPRIARRLGVISFGLRHVPHNLAAEELAETAGFGVRTGCHCAHILVKRLLRIHPAREALSNLGLMFAPRITASFLPGLVRVSLGLENEEADIRRLAHALHGISGRRPDFVSRLLAKTRNATPFLPNTETLRRIRAAVDRDAQRGPRHSIDFDQASRLFSPAE
jgi:selenocysteine lyase/cysteine desulfurase